MAVLWRNPDHSRQAAGLGSTPLATKKSRFLSANLSALHLFGIGCKFRAVMNFCQNEGWIERNPAKGLQVIDRVRRRDKRLPFSAEQLRLIFDAPIYRGCVDDWAGYSTPGYAHPRRGRFTSANDIGSRSSPAS